MVYKTCQKCGSDNLISDRSLGGKIVCARCGSSSFKSKNILNKNNKAFFFLLLMILIFILIII